MLSQCEKKLGFIHCLEPTNEMTVLKIGKPPYSHYYIPKYMTEVFPKQACSRYTIGPNRKRAFSRNHITTVDKHNKKTTIMLCARNRKGIRSAIIPGTTDGTFDRCLLAEKFVRTHCPMDVVLETTYPNIVFNGIIKDIDFSSMSKIQCVFRMKNYRHALKIQHPKHKWNITVYKTAKVVFTGVSTYDGVILSCRFLKHIIDECNKQRSSPHQISPA